MIIEQPIETHHTIYQFTFEKKHQYKDEVDINIDVEGIFSLQKNKSDRFDDSLNHIFKFQKYIAKGVKEPLIFDSINWIFNLKLNVAVVGGKDILEIEWRKFRDKHRQPENMVAINLLESLYFKNLLGMEYSFLSNAPYLVFFVNYYDKNIEVGDVFRGINFILMPMSIPINSWYKCAKIDSNYLDLEGWVTLDEEFLEKMLFQKEFKEHAKSYHFSKDFRIESDIRVRIDVKTGTLHTAKFKMDINGDNGKLKETMSYQIKSNINDNPNQSFVVGPLVEIDGGKKKWW